MSLVIGNGTVSKIVIGGETFKQPDYSTTWFDCPDNGKKGLDFVGTTIMKWNEDSGVANFRSGAACLASDTNTERLVITLPKGFFFSGDNPQNLTVSNAVTVDQSLRIRYETNKLFVTFAGDTTNSTYPYYFISQNLRYNNDFTQGIKFNVIKDN